jgi:multidrug resistance efflux pump
MIKMRLPRFNLVYLALPVAIWGLYRIYEVYSVQSTSFYGMAENKETQINFDHDLLVHKVHVTPGQSVKKGDLLLEVSRLGLDFKLNDLQLGINELEARDAEQIAEVQTKIARLITEKAEKLAEIEAEIKEITTERDLNLWLAQDLKTLPDSAFTPPAATDLNTVKINSLRAAMRTVAAPYEVEIAQLQQLMTLGRQPYRAEMDRLRNESQLQEKERERLKICAPSDGLVGSVQCKAGEHVSSFNPLISFYEEHPNLVVGYVHESLITGVQIGDSIQVASSLQPDNQMKGRISALGHRVVEIPERLRKIPEIKTYGREILIDIPPKNNFLQKEKVSLRLGGHTPLW